MSRSRFLLGLAIVLLVVNGIAVMGTRPLGAQRESSVSSTSKGANAPGRQTKATKPFVVSKKATASLVTKPVAVKEIAKQAPVAGVTEVDLAKPANANELESALSPLLEPSPSLLLGETGQLLTKPDNAADLLPNFEPEKILAVANASPSGPKDEDPEQAANTFLANARREAEAAVKALNEEAESLRERLKKVESAAKRWETLLTALETNNESPKIDKSTNAKPTNGPKSNEAPKAETPITVPPPPVLPERAASSPRF